jgi:hypothetical protein
MKHTFNYLSTLVALALSHSVIAGVKTNDNTRVQDYDALKFNTEQQSIWDSGSGEAFKVDWQLTETQWRDFVGKPITATLGFGSVIDECILGVCAKVGAAAGLKSETYVLPYFNAEAEGGSFDAAVTFKPTVEYQYEGLGVDFSSLDATAGMLNNASELTVRAPSFELDTGLNIKSSLSLFAEACFLGCPIDESFPIASAEFKLPLIQLSTKGDGLLKVFSPPTNVADAIGLFPRLLDNLANADSPESFLTAALDSGLYSKDIGEILFKGAEDRLAANDPDVLKGTKTQKEASDEIKQKISDAEDLLANNPVSGSLSNPYSGAVITNFGNDTLNAELGGELANVTLDVDQLIGLAIGFPGGGTASLDTFGLGNDLISLELTLGDVKIGPKIDLTTNLTIAPELMVRLDFNTDVLLKGEVGRQDSWTGRWEDIPNVALIAPDFSAFVFNSEQDKIGDFFNENAAEASATPTFFVESTVTNETFIEVSAQASIKLFEAKIGLAGFDGGTIGPLVNETIDSGVLATVDLYSNTFEANEWGDEQSSPASYLDKRGVQDGTDAGKGVDADGKLTFNAAGEVAFQARRKEFGDVAGNDDRVGGNLSISQLITDINNIQPYGRNAFGESGFSENNPLNELFPYVSAYDLSNDSVERVTQQQLQIQSGQLAQVMQDGQLTIDQDFVVEAGGTLELGVTPEVDTKFSEDRGILITPKKILTVHGTVFSSVETNTPSSIRSLGGSIEIGRSGVLKSDADLLFLAGKISNNGRLEITSNDSRLTTVKNAYGAEFDSYGSVTVAGGENAGTMTARTGGTLQFSDRSMAFAFGPEPLFINRGELVVEEDAALNLLVRGNQGGNFVLENRHIIDNNGLLQNDAGQTIVNGQAGFDWAAWRTESDLAGKARGDREALLGDLNSQMATADVDVINNVFATESARQDFISTTNDAVSTVETVAGLFSEGQRKFIRDLSSATVKFNASAKAFQDRFGFTFDKSLSDPIVSISCTKVVDCFQRRILVVNDSFAVDNARTTAESGQALFGATIKNIGTNQEIVAANEEALKKENLFGKSIDALVAARTTVTGIATEIDKAILAAEETGFGLLRNGPDGVLFNDGQLTNHALIENEFGGSIINSQNGNLDNKGYVRNKGELINLSGTMVNEGVIDNGLEALGSAGLSKLSNFGEFNNHGELVNRDTLDNFRGLVNGEATNAGATSEALIYNTGSVNNYGNLTNNANFINESGAGLNNDSRLVNNGTLINEGVFNNGRHAELKEGEQEVSLFNFNFGANLNAAYKQGILKDAILKSKLEEELKDLNARREELIGSASLEELQRDFDYNQREYYECKSYIFTFNTCNVTKLGIKLNNSDGRLQRFIATNAKLDKQESDLTTQLATATQFDSVVLTDLNPALLSSAETASLENNGVLLNRGLLNNVGTITNNDTGVIMNSGVMVVGEGALVDNQGALMVVRESIATGKVNKDGVAQTIDQVGMVLSNGKIDNSGVIDISAGVFSNGTSAGSDAVLSNSGQVQLNGALLGMTVNSAGDIVAFQKETASLMNYGTINNVAGGEIQIGNDDALIQQFGQYSVNTLANFGQINNEQDASITNHGLLFNAGMIDNQAGSTFENFGVLNNTQEGEIAFAEKTTLGGQVINNGLITMTDTAVLTLTGNIAGSGTFAGDTLIQGLGANELQQATVNPGNSPGLLTFDGNVQSGENVNWLMEIWGDERGISYDAIDITGSFRLLAELSLSVLSILSFDDLFEADFTYFSIGGDLLDDLGNAYTQSFDFMGFSDFSDGWTGTWIKEDIAGWSLNLAFSSASDAQDSFAAYSTSIDQYTQLVTRTATSVSAPATLYILALGLASLFWSRRRSVRPKTQ